MERRSKRRGLKVIFGRAALALLVPALLVELVLQAAAWWVADAAQRPASAPTDARARTVLCVGDSYTYGIGASDAGHSYPGRLAAKLAERSGAEWKVENCGWPGRNSRELLRELPQQIDRCAPAFVCFLVGTNDGWSRPGELLRESGLEEAAGGGFRFEWRTRRLAELVWNAFELRGRVSAAPPPAPKVEGAALIGNWRVADGIARFDADGRCYWQEHERRYTVERRQLIIEAQDGLPAVKARWRVPDGRLRLRLEGAIEETVHPMPRHVRAPVDPAVAAALASGDRAAAQARLGELRAVAEQSPEAAAACLAAKVACDRGQPSMALARELLEKFPDHVELLDVLAEQAHGAGDDVSARVAVERALELAPPSEPLLRADLHRLRVIVLRRVEPREAVWSIAESFRIDGNREQAAAALRAQLALTPKVGRSEFLDSTCFEPDVQARLALIWEAASAGAEGDAGDDEAACAILESHLRQAIALCRSRGATPVLLSYPFRDRFLARVFARFSADAELRRVAIHAEFELLMKDHAREEFFVTDGHCNDAGYDIVAGLVAEAMLR